MPWIRALDVLVAVGFARSKSEARRQCRQGAWIYDGSALGEVDYVWHPDDEQPWVFETYDYRRAPASKRFLLYADTEQMAKEASSGIVSDTAKQTE